MEIIRKVLEWFRLPLIFLALLVAMPALTQEIQAPVYKDGDFWMYKAREWDFVTQSSNPLGGEYELVYRGGKFEIFSLQDGQKNPVAEGREANILRGLFENKKDILKQAKATEEEVKNFEGKNIAPGGISRAFKAEFTESRRSRGITSILDLTYFYGVKCDCFVYYYMDSSRRTGSGGKREIILLRFGRN